MIGETLHRLAKRHDVPAQLDPLSRVPNESLELLR